MKISGLYPPGTLLSGEICPTLRNELDELLYNKTPHSRKESKLRAIGMKVKICVGESCHLQGAENVVRTFKKNLESASIKVEGADNVQLTGCFCMNNCQKNRVSVVVDTVKHSIHPLDADTFFNTELKPKG